MTDERVRRWVEAAKVLGQDPFKKVNCPECEHEYLEVMDVDNQLNPVQFERYMHCRNCKARNILRMTRK